MTRAEILNRLRVMVVSLAVQAVVGIADYVTGNELHVDVFYFIPISITAWYLRRGDVVVRR
jgi:heme A synthase